LFVFAKAREQGFAEALEIKEKERKMQKLFRDL